MTTRAEAKAQTRQRLLDAMLAILHESGPLALTTGRIAERAGLAQPTFYVHFPDLDRAIEMAADEAGARLIRILTNHRTTIETGDGSKVPGGRLRQAFRTALDAFVSDRQTTELFLRHRRDTASPFATRFRSVLAAGRMQLVEMLAKDGVAAPDVVAALLLGLLTATVEGVLDGRIASTDVAVDHLVLAARPLLAPAAPSGGTHGAA